MKAISKITSLLLLLVFLYAAAPKELVHEIFHEHESSDTSCRNETGDQLSILHEHCELLQLNNPPVYFSVSTFSFSVTEFVFSVKAPNDQEYKFSSSPFLFFRGPPQLG